MRPDPVKTGAKKVSKHEGFMFKMGTRVSLAEMNYDGVEIADGESGTVVALYPDLGGADIKLDVDHPELWPWGNTVHLVSPEIDDVTLLKTVTRRKRLPACIDVRLGVATLCISLLPLKPLALFFKPLGHAMTHPIALIFNWVFTAGAFASEAVTEWTTHLL